MSIMQVHHFSSVAIVALVGLTFSPIAQARELIITGSQGRTTVVDTFNRQGTANGSTVQRAVTLPNGRVYNQSVDVRGTGNGGYERNVIWTGPQGKQTTVQGVGTFQNGVLNGTRTVTYPNGRSRTSSYRSQP
jgi:antitoxin component YwqK of YwqJK toxin-antitoxin module